MKGLLTAYFFLVIILSVRAFKKQRWSCILSKRSKHFSCSITSLSSSTHIGAPFLNYPNELKLCKFDGPGCILLAKPDEYDHFFHHAVILLFEHNSKGSLGLMVDKPSAFTMGEMTPNSEMFAPNILYTGGSDGSDTAVMLHKYDLGPYAKPVGSRGLYLGGLKEAKELVLAFKAHPRDFKFIFNNVQWGPGVLEKEIAAGKWDVCEAPADVVVNSDRVKCIWQTMRNVLFPNS